MHTSVQRLCGTPIASLAERHVLPVQRQAELRDGVSGVVFTAGRTSCPPPRLRPQRTPFASTALPVKHLPRPWPPRARAPRPQSAVEMGDTRSNKRLRTSSDPAPAAGKAASVSTLEHPSNAAGVSLQSTQVAVPGSAAHDGAPASSPPHGGAGAPGPHETEEALSNPPPARCVPV